MILRAVVVLLLGSFFVVGSNGQSIPTGPEALPKANVIANPAGAQQAAIPGVSGNAASGVKGKSNGLVPPSTPLATVRNTEVLVLADKQGCNTYVTPYGVALRVCDATGTQLPIKVLGKVIHPIPSHYYPLTICCCFR